MKLNGSSWVNVGTNPLNVKTNHDARYSALALDGAGNPVVALQECDPASCFYDIHVKRYVANGWQALGKPLDITLTNEALNSSITRKSNNRPDFSWQALHAYTHA